MKYFTIIILFTVLISCVDKDKNSTLSIADDYTVFNQVLPHLGVFELCLDSTERTPIKKYLYDSIETRNIMKLLLKRGIDTNNIKIHEINILVIGDSQHRFRHDDFERKESARIDLSKLNMIPSCLLVTSDSIPFNKDRLIYNSITLSRVLFDKDIARAVFSIGIYKGPLNGHVFYIYGEFQNGEWRIISKDLIMVS